MNSKKLTLSLLLLGWPLHAETTITQEVEGGVQGVDLSANEAKFEEYGHVSEGAIVPSYKLRSQNEKTQIDFQAKNVRENTQAYSLNVNHNSAVKVDVSYEESPHVYSNIARTLYVAESPGVYRLPNQLQTDLQNQQTTSTASISTSNFNTRFGSYAQASHDVPLRINDRKSAIDLKFRGGEAWKFKMGFSEDRINGNKPFGASFGFNNEIQMPLPVDWKVYNAKAGTEFSTEKFQMGFNYAMSAFNNRTETFIWDNPKRITDRYNNNGGYSPGDQSALGRMPLAPDNIAHYVKFNTGVQLPAKSRFTMEQSLGYMRQNEDLVPFTINTAMTPAALGSGNVGAANTPTFDASKLSSLPVKSANTLMRTWTQTYALSNRIIKPLSLGVKYRSFQLQNRSAEVDFAGHSVADQIWAQEDTPTHRFQYKKENVEGTMDWDVARALGVGVKYGAEWLKRDHREIKESVETTFATNMDVRPTRWFLLRGGFLTANRQAKDFEIADYQNESATYMIEAAGLRRYDIANRLRNQGTALLQLTPGPVTLAFHGRLTHDQFAPGHGDLTGGFATGTQSSARRAEVNQAQMYGLLESRVAAGGMDLDWDWSERVGVGFYYEFEQDRSIQRSNNTAVATNANPETTQDAATDWSVRTMERYHIAGASLKFTAVPDKVNVKLGYDFVDSRGGTNFFNVGTDSSVRSAAITPPDTKNRTQTASLKSEYKATPRLSLTLAYLYQKFEVSDFALQGLPLVGGSAASQSSTFLGANLQNYVAHVTSLVAKYKF